MITPWQKLGLLVAEHCRLGASDLVKEDLVDAIYERIDKLDVLDELELQNMRLFQHPILQRIRTHSLAFVILCFFNIIILLNY